MDVAILGASGDCGREIAARIVSERLLAPTERLQLVGRSGGSSARVLHGLASDITDAYAEFVPELDVALSPREIFADVWVVACGVTVPTGGKRLDRRELAAHNAAIFAGYADALARYGQGTEIVIVVSNPVELGVALFARALGKHRVIGIGAFQDTLRFRREMAADLGVRRQRVSGFMLGEHGEAQLPIWSSVQILGMDKDERRAAIANFRRGTEGADFQQLCRTENNALQALLAEGCVAEAFTRVDTLPPDVRVVLKPLITHLSGAKTVMATANVTVDLLSTLLQGDEVLVAGQVALDKDDFYGMTGPLGVPIIATPNGIRRIVEIPLTEQEQCDLRRISISISEKVQHWIQAVDSAHTEAL